MAAAAAAQLLCVLTGMCAFCTCIPFDSYILRAGGGDQSWLSVQVGRLRRELERMESERDKAREAASQ